MNQNKLGDELTRTNIFPDPSKAGRFIRGVLYGEKDTGKLIKMQVWFYYKETDNDPFWKTSYGLQGTDDSFVAYHRRQLFHGLQNNLMRKFTKNN